jgi:hypothetical protein
VRAVDCARRFVFLAAGGVRVVWACGAEKDFPDEPAVDVEFLTDHLADVTHHHRHHLHHKERR